MCLAGAVVALWFLTQEVAGSNNTTRKAIVIPCQHGTSKTFGKYDPDPFSSLLVTLQNIQSLSVTLLSYLSYLELGVGLFLNLLERTDIFYLYYLTFPLE